MRDRSLLFYLNQRLLPLVVGWAGITAINPAMDFRKALAIDHFSDGFNSPIDPLMEYQLRISMFKINCHSAAAVYRQYLKNCDAAQVTQAKQNAKQSGSSIWNPSNLLNIIPWDYRHNFLEIMLA